MEELKSIYPPNTLFKVPGIGDDKYDFRFFYMPEQGKKNGGYYQGKPTSSDITKKPYPNFYNFEQEYNNVAKQGGVSLRNAKKPEELLKFLVDLFTKKGEIVLDYHLGSGTTCAVAHKMGRQYIGIEQLDYGKNDSVVRLKNVIGKANSKGKLSETIEGYDTTGISKAVNWKGGGNFVYCELKELNEQFIQKIQTAKDTKELLKIWEEMKKQSFLSYKIDPKRIDANAEDFKDLSLENQKKFLIECLDKNDLYVNYSEIDDTHYNVSKEDKELNNRFYGRL
ncbi:hypothetical protein ES705_32625 [subsurface metagenome]